MNPVLASADVHLRWGTRSVLAGVSLALEAPSILGLLGPNGCGKTTLLRLLAGLIRPTSGQVTLYGRSLTRWPVRALATKLGYLPQHPPQTLAYSVREFIGFGRFAHESASAGERNTRMVDAILEEFALASLADAAVDTLSGGEWQMVRIARVVAQDTDVVVLDEPATALDLKHQDFVAKLFVRLRSRGKVVVFSTHDPTFALQLCDQVLLFDGSGPSATPVAAKAITSESLSRSYGVPVQLAQFPGFGTICGVASRAPITRTGTGRSMERPSSRNPGVA